MDNKRKINLFCALVGRHNLAFYISGSDDCQQMEGEGADRVSQTVTPCNYPDASRGTSGMDQDDSVLMKVALQKSTRGCHYSHSNPLLRRRDRLLTSVMSELWPAGEIQPLLSGA